MRYLPLTEADRQEMLAAIGAPSVDALFGDVPAAAHLDQPIAGLAPHQGELQVERALSRLAARNVPAGSCPSFLGAGAYRHHVPASVDQLLTRGEFLTSYTPYQPEVTQGTLQYLFEFQTQVALITGMDVANASMYDGATACAEAVLMANRVTRRNRAVLSGGLHPHYRDVTATTTGVLGVDLVTLPADPKGIEDLAAAIDDKTSCVVVQNPTLFGHVADLTALAEACHAKGALLVVVVTEVVSLGLMPSPGSMGADIVVAEGQSIGNGLNFGGPYLGLFATRDKFVRQMPGRLCGETVDADGKRGFVLTLSTREQHIRREKATSNICTNSGLCALAFTMHLSLLGEVGFTGLARLNHAKAVQLADKLAAAGLSVLNQGFFNEFTVQVAGDAAALVDRLAAEPILAGVPVSRLHPGQADLADLLLVAVTETTTEDDMDALVQALGGKQ
ncbi:MULTISPECIES: aminomethyl-transferring glycine dehydrogenase subunit GcvPA [Nitrospirillum]|uniref:Probable glycine dehydrogenase (decarboxylating) subunit 1 n=1 Tax=Nitrospirillum amazonense TaxID=28077 RepID=A0A560FZA8_9PROT|nr:aminomethyl-transferring glycine dehydrogenase subunit GcvPA [Nitrospirillum amazonense]MEC4592432.1 aminomethyl-transferring glycine dehydrogenase subunit GcvPA [Nitrospirillum amazonense]TWB26891.1 glycine dehydrogenase (decarboxylating) alpha subunit [Nitrospirillum amazonense]